LRKDPILRTRSFTSGRTAGRRVIATELAARIVTLNNFFRQIYSVSALKINVTNVASATHDNLKYEQRNKAFKLRDRWVGCWCCSVDAEARLLSSTGAGYDADI